MRNNSNEVSFEIVKKIGILSTSEAGWTKELNMVSWNNNNPKYDIRDWAPDHKHMSRGITLNFEQALTLKKLLEEEIV